MAAKLKKRAMAEYNSSVVQVRTRSTLVQWCSNTGFAGGGLQLLVLLGRLRPRQAAQAVPEGEHQRCGECGEEYTCTQHCTQNRLLQVMESPSVLPSLSTEALGVREVMANILGLNTR